MTQQALSDANASFRLAQGAAEGAKDSTVVDDRSRQSWLPLGIGTLKFPIDPVLVDTHRKKLSREFGCPAGLRNLATALMDPANRRIAIVGFLQSFPPISPWRSAISDRCMDN